MRGLTALLAVGICGVPHVAPADDLIMLPSAQMTVERATPLDSFAAPQAVFSDGKVPAVTLEGAVSRRAWRIDQGGLSPLEVMAPLRSQLPALGYDIIFECSSADCGGFDFRFAVEVLPGPNMYVNIGSYRYLTALKGDSEALTILASTTSASAYVQIIHVGPAEAATAPPQRPVARAPVAQPEVEETQPDLLTNGFQVLSDLEFDTGSTRLGPGAFASLDALADVLRADPDLRVALVGHTDTVGGLAPNIALSRARAEAVRARLVEDHGIAADRLDAEGMGYLAPVASNRTPEGREQNRRVEVILLNTEE